LPNRARGSFRRLLKRRRWRILKRTMMFLVAVMEPCVRRVMLMLLVAALMASLFAALVANPAEAGTRLRATPSSLDFGEVPAGEPSQVKNVKLKNRGTKRITIFPSISGVDSSNFSVEANPITIRPGKTKVVPVTFTPSGKSGTKTGSLELKNKNGSTVRTVPLGGVVGDLLIEATPSPVDFGTSVVGDPPMIEEVTLKNNGASSVTITPSISGVDASSFSVPTDFITIAPGATAVLEVTFTPSGILGSKSGNLLLQDADGNTVGPIPLSGAVQSLFEATPSTLNFGGAAFCCPTEEVTLKNNGANTVIITPSISGTNASYFSVPTNPITILPGATPGLTVFFVPGCPNGAKTGSLDLKDAGGNTVGTVALTGTTVNPFC
jgi:hypothetical protein